MWTVRHVDRLACGRSSMYGRACRCVRDCLRVLTCTSVMAVFGQHRSEHRCHNVIITFVSDQNSLVAGSSEMFQIECYKCHSEISAKAPLHSKFRPIKCVVEGVSSDRLIRTNNLLASGSLAETLHETSNLAISCADSQIRMPDIWRNFNPGFRTNKTR